MPEIAHDAARAFAVEVVRILRAAGFEALWAGGCVRDRLLGLTPKDYDVATNAVPEQIRQLFGFKRTIPVGAAFGVITVLGPRNAGQVEVATFRSDGAYYDGRHPTSVTFSTAEHDAQRRDFTMNGLFFDPLTEQVHDYVNGEHDLRQGIVRAIRDPRERFQEDKLRMLRAIRFAATFGFEIETETLTAIRSLANEIVIVSAERVAAEMRRMLIHPRRALAVELLQASELLPAILPEAVVFNEHEATQDAAVAQLRWRTTLAMLENVANPNFPTAFALLLRAIAHLPEDDPAIQHAIQSGHFREYSPAALAAFICRRWKLANDEIECVCWLLSHEGTIRSAEEVPWPKLQRVLVSQHCPELLNYASAVERVLDGNDRSVQYCREKLALPPEVLNPPLLITGLELKQLGLAPGPAFKEILESVRDRQLEGRIHTPAEALHWVQQIAGKIQ